MREIKAPLDKIVSKYSEKDFIDILDELGKEISSLKAIKGRKQHLTDYINIGKEVLFFLSSGIKPTGMSDYDFNKLKPMIKMLVEKGQLKESVMTYFD